MTDLALFVVVFGVFGVVWGGVVWGLHRLLDALDAHDVLQDFK